jgi:hypothetical protein
MRIARVRTTPKPSSIASRARRNLPIPIVLCRSGIEFGRTLLGAAVLLPIALHRGALRRALRVWPWVLAFGAVEMALANALESVGRFRLLVSTSLTSMAVIVVGAVVTTVTGSWRAAPIALILAALLRHIVQVLFTARFGALDGRSLARGYFSALVCSAVLGVAVALVLAGMVGRIGPSAAIAGTVILVAAISTGVVMRRHLPPVQILARYHRKPLRENSLPDPLS